MAGAKPKVGPKKMRSGGGAKKKPVKRAVGGPAIGTAMGNRLHPAINQHLLDKSGLTQEEFADLTSRMDTQQKTEDAKNKATAKQRLADSVFGSGRPSVNEMHGGSPDYMGKINDQLFQQIAQAMGRKGTVTIEEIFPPKGKARGGEIKASARRKGKTGSQFDRSLKTSPRKAMASAKNNTQSSSKVDKLFTTTKIGRDKDGNLLAVYPKKAKGGAVKKATGGAVKKMRGGPVKKMRSGGAVGCGAAKRGYGAVKRGR